MTKHHGELIEKYSYIDKVDLIKGYFHIQYTSGGEKKVKRVHTRTSIAVLQKIINRIRKEADGEKNEERRKKEQNIFVV